MGTFAAVMTGKGMGAIATVQVLGDGAAQVLHRIFQPAGSKPAQLSPNRIALGAIVDPFGHVEGEDHRILDQVVIGCEAEDLYAIHCHGNPLIVEAVMAMLERSGVTLVTPDALLSKVLLATGADAIEVEARLVQLAARTLDGVRLVASQVTAGLRPLLVLWHNQSLEQIRDQAKRVLAASVPARLIINGCTTAIVGPPNSGKSTLFNRLAGQDKALVTDIRGTTRDWVQAECRGPLCLDLIDTAGLDSGLRDPIDKASQAKTLEIIAKADLILLVLDASQTGEPLNALQLGPLDNKNVIPVLNKFDLPSATDPLELPCLSMEPVRLSAKLGTGIDSLMEAIGQVTGTAGLAPSTPVAFTDRQRDLTARLSGVQSQYEALDLIQQMLHGPLAAETWQMQQGLVS